MNGWFQSMAELGSNLRGGKDYIWHHIYTRASEHIHIDIVFEINLQNNNSFMCMLSNIWMQENSK